MAGLNKVMIIGNLGRDPETTYTQAGAAICKIAVATSETWNDKNTGEKREKTEWHRITSFGKQAETVEKHFSKGMQIYVEGKLQTSQYEKNGVTHYSTDIIMDKFLFIGNKNEKPGQGQQPQQNKGGFQQQQQGQGVINQQWQGNYPPPNDFQQTPDYSGGGFQQHTARR